MYRSDSAVYVLVWQCSVCTGLTVQCMKWSDSAVYVPVWQCSVCTGLTVQCMYWSDSAVNVPVWQCSVCTGLTVQCMYRSDSAVYEMVWQCSVCTSVTQLYLLVAVYLVLHKVQPHVSALDSGQLQVVHAILSKQLYEAIMGCIRWYSREDEEGTRSRVTEVRSCAYMGFLLLYVKQ